MMENRTGNVKRTLDPAPEVSNEKYLEEYDGITNKLTLAEGEEIFPLLVKLMRICRKLHVPFPVEYAQYYSQKKSQLSTELRYIDKRIMLSQINNENYSHLERRKEYISNTLGITVH